MGQKLRGHILSRTPEKWVIKYLTHYTVNSRHPVTNINWRDAVVWCNALTEWYNSKKGTSYGCVYKTGVTPIRDARDSNSTVVEGVVPDNSATGFRLPDKQEWELAARYIADTNKDGDLSLAGEYYPWDHVSGDTTSHCFPVDAYVSTVVVNYAWYSDNSGNTNTSEVKQMLPNALGIYDLCGNVWEFMIDISYSNVQRRGGSFANSSDGIQVGQSNIATAAVVADDGDGLRVARSAE